MTHFSVITWSTRGSSLIETAIAMSVLAVAIPLVFGALAESGKSTLSSEAETRSTWIIPACMEEIQASRSGRPQFFATTVVDEPFPPIGGVWALGFSGEGQAVGTLTKSEYDSGTQEIAEQSIRYIATLKAEKTLPGDLEAEPKPSITPILRVQISLEFPAISPANKRQKLQFYSRIP